MMLKRRLSRSRIPREISHNLAVGPTVLTGSSPASQAIYYATKIASANANANSVVVTFTKTAYYPDVRILEYKGISNSNPVDAKVASSSAGGISSNSGMATTNNANDLLLGANFVWSSTTGPGQGYAKRLVTPDKEGYRRRSSPIVGGARTVRQPL